MKPKHMVAVAWVGAAALAAAGEPVTNRTVQAGPLAGFTLTAEQEAQSARIMREHRPRIREALQAAAAARRALFEKTYADRFDEAAVREAAKRAGACDEELSVVRARLMGDVRAILTPDQRAKLSAAREEMLRSLDARAKREGTLLDAWIEDHAP